MDSITQGKGDISPLPWKKVNYQRKQNKIVLDQVDLEKAQKEDGTLHMVRTWFNETTGKVEDKKIDTSEFESVHEDVLQLYKVRKQLRLTDNKTTSKTRLIY